MTASVTSSFDPIAGLYHRLWSGWYLPAALPALERLFFSRIAPACRVLDVCCGSGHVTKEIVRRGFQVTGIDISAELIALAREQMPDVDFQVQDARCFSLPDRYQAALSTFDSLNHILSLDELQSVFERVYAALESGGLFVFDMNLREAFRADLRGWAVDAGDESVSLIRGLFDEERNVARTELIWFQKNGGGTWGRSDSAIEEKCYGQSDIVLALGQAGFKLVESIPASDAGMQADLGFGRIFITAVA